MTRLLPLAALLVVAAGPVLAETAAKAPPKAPQHAADKAPSNRPEDGAFISQVTFTCERGTVVAVAYVNNTPDANSFAVAQIDGHQIPMIQVRSGSGIRYRSVDPNRPYELHAKGDAGMIFYGPEPDPATILKDCKAR